MVSLAKPEVRKFLIIVIAAIAASQLLRQHPEWGSLLPDFGSESRSGQVDPTIGLPPNAGVVTRILPDDLVGSRHQKFILRLANGETLLVAHNIDIAPRVNGLQVGDVVEFNGVFETNAQGGVIHWTHHDPSGRRPGGWLRHNGRFYK
jgi:hypothetical protein